MEQLDAGALLSRPWRPAARSIPSVNKGGGGGVEEAGRQEKGRVGPWLAYHSDGINGCVGFKLAPDDSGGCVSITYPQVARPPLIPHFLPPSPPSLPLVPKLLKISIRIRRTSIFSPLFESNPADSMMSKLKNVMGANEITQPAAASPPHKRADKHFQYLISEHAAEQTRAKYTSAARCLRQRRAGAGRRGLSGPSQPKGLALGF